MRAASGYQMHSETHVHLQGHTANHASTEYKYSGVDVPPCQRVPCALLRPCPSQRSTPYSNRYRSSANRIARRCVYLLEVTAIISRDHAQTSPCVHQVSTISLEEDDHRQRLNVLAHLL